MIDLSGFLFQPLFHQSAYLELNGTFGWDGNALECLWILSNPGSTDARFKHAEVSEFQAVTVTKLVDDLVEEFLNDAFHKDTLGPCGIRDSVDEFFLCDGGHIVSSFGFVCCEFAPDTHNHGGCPSKTTFAQVILLQWVRAIKMDLKPVRQSGKYGKILIDARLTLDDSRSA